MKRSTNLFILVILIGVAIAVTAYLWPVKETKPDKDKPLMKEITTSSKTKFAKGVVKSLDEAEISSKVVGLIRGIKAAENESVEKGQSLVILDDREARAQSKEAEASWAKAKANYEKAAIDYERYERLYKRDAITLNELQDSETKLKLLKGEYNEAEARLEYARAMLQNYTLTSPIKGIVTRKYLEVGEITKQGTPVLLVANPEALRIKAELDETDVGGVFDGQKVEVLVDAFPGRIFKGFVEKISKDVKRKAVRTFDPVNWMDINSQEITIMLDSFEGLKIGMTVDVKFLY